MGTATETITWRTSNRDGTLNEPAPVAMRSADVAVIRSRWREVAELPTGADKTRGLNELRTLMDIFACFPGTVIR